MTQKEYANQLFKRFYIELPQWVNNEDAKKCALIAVDEIIKLRKGYFDCTNPMQDELYWQQVKTEIKLL
jgi:hypothetical protein